MARTEVADELAAMKKMVTLLEKLDPEVRERTLVWAYDRYMVASLPTKEEALAVVTDNPDDRCEAEDTVSPHSAISNPGFLAP